MRSEKMNPATPARAVTGLGWASSAATLPEYHITAAVVHKLQHADSVSELHAATIAYLAGLGPQEVRS